MNDTWYMGEKLDKQTCNREWVGGLPEVCVIGTLVPSILKKEKKNPAVTTLISHDVSGFLVLLLP